MFDSMKKTIHTIIKHECDDLIIDIMREKLDIQVFKDGEFIVFRVKFANTLIREDKVQI